MIKFLNLILGWVPSLAKYNHIILLSKPPIMAKRSWTLGYIVIGKFGYPVHMCRKLGLDHDLPVRIFKRLAGLLTGGCGRQIFTFNFFYIEFGFVRKVENVSMPDVLVWYDILHRKWWIGIIMRYFSHVHQMAFLVSNCKYKWETCKCYSLLHHFWVFFAFFHSVADKVEVKGYFLTEILPHNLQMWSYSGQTIKV